MRITAQLIEASSDRHLWSESYERDLREIWLFRTRWAKLSRTRFKSVWLPRR